MLCGIIAFHRVQLHYLDALEPKDIETAFRAAAKGRAAAVPVLGDPFILSNRTQIAELAVRNRFPPIYYSTEFVEHGGLMSYGVSFIDLHRHPATYVDKILKGAKPAGGTTDEVRAGDQSENSEQIGLTIPPEVLE